MPLSLTTQVQTRFSDLDPLGHVNNIAFFTYMETARVRLVDQVRESIGRLLVARSECDHLAEIGAHVRAVDVTVSVESLGRTSLVMVHELVVEGVLVARGRAVLVKVDAAHRPVPLTDEERALLLAE